MTKPDSLDQKIRLLVAELVDLAPLPPPLPDGDALRRWRERRRRRLAFRSLTVASAAAAVAVAAALAVPAGLTASPHWALAGVRQYPAAPRRRPDDRGRGGAALSSADGGRTWLSTGLPKGIAGVGPLSCPDPSTCFALAFKTRSTPSSGAPEGPLTFALLMYTKSHP